MGAAEGGGGGAGDGRWVNTAGVVTEWRRGHLREPWKPLHRPWTFWKTKRGILSLSKGTALWDLHLGKTDGSMAERGLEEDKGESGSLFDCPGQRGRWSLPRQRPRGWEEELLKENFWEGRITTTSYFPGFYTPTQLINPHTNPLRRISPMVFYFSRKKWAPGGWLRGRKLPPRETPHAQAGILSTVLQSLQLTSLRFRSCWPHSVKMRVIWEKSHWQGDQVEREILSEKILPSVVQKIMLLWKPFLERLNNQRITREIYFYFVG